MLKARILYEHGADGRPFGSAYLRLIRPLTHPKVVGDMSVDFSSANDGPRADVILVDRLWRPDLSSALARELVSSARREGAKLIACLDDSFHDLKREDTPPADKLDALDILLDNAEGVIVTTPQLAERVRPATRTVIIVPNALDERLLTASAHIKAANPQQIVIGYMGTYTHDADLRMILPALAEVKARLGRMIAIEMIGGSLAPDVNAELERLGAIWLSPPPGDDEYPSFMLWFTSRVRWEIAIAPLRDDAFNACKSDLKLLDYSAIGAATVFSRVRAYDTVSHLEHGLIADSSPAEWNSALMTLATDDALRQRIARKASQYLYDHRTLASRTNKDLGQAIRDVMN